MLETAYFTESTINSNKNKLNSKIIYFFSSAFKHTLNVIDHQSRTLAWCLILNSYKFNFYFFIFKIAKNYIHKLNQNNQESYKLTDSS